MLLVVAKAAQETVLAELNQSMAVLVRRVEGEQRAGSTVPVYLVLPAARKLAKPKEPTHSLVGRTTFMANIKGPNTGNEPVSVLSD